MLHCGSCTAQRFYAALQQRVALQHIAMQHCAMQQLHCCVATWHDVSRGTIRHVQLFHVEQLNDYK